MKKVVWLGLFCLLALIPSSVLAADWVFAEKYANYTNYVDKATLSYDADGNFMRFTSKTELSAPIKAGGLNEVVIVIRETEVKLAEPWKLRHLQATFREARGKEEKHVVSNPRWVGCSAGMPLNLLVEQALHIAKTGSRAVQKSRSI